MALVWIRAQVDFRHKAHCERLAERLQEIEETRLDRMETVRAARELQMMLGVVVDQLMRSRTEYVQPSLFQRVLVQSYLDEATAQGRRALAMLDEATDGMPQSAAAALRSEWFVMQTWFTVQPEELQMMRAIVGVAKK
jgi:hypothetical protein